MNSTDNETTIVAISTPPGQGGIGVVRLSGPDSIGIANGLFDSKPPLGKRMRYVEYGHIIIGGNRIDSGLAWVLKAPRSYTGEDTVEISCHGSMIVLESLVQAAISAGAVIAAPGEFTRRAFLNGNIDLLQAEAVVDLIQAGNRHTLHTAYSHSEGHLSRQIHSFKEQLIEVLSKLEVNLDFSEEEIVSSDRIDLLAVLDSILRQIEKLTDTFHGHIQRKKGFLIVLVGPPNVGKSSLLNLLLGEDRAIVTSIPGTTRDLIQGHSYIDGREVRFIDTAGLRDTDNPVEVEGIKRSLGIVEEADVVIGILDRSVEWSSDNERTLDIVNRSNGLLLLNKSDLPVKMEIPVEKKDRFLILETSAITRAGLDQLSLSIASLLPQISDDGLYITRQRHRDILLRCHDHVTRSKLFLEQGHSEELVIQELMETLRFLGQLLGEDVDEVVLDRIFSDFCIGK